MRELPKQRIRSLLGTGEGILSVVFRESEAMDKSFAHQREGLKANLFEVTHFHCQVSGRAGVLAEIT